MADTSTTPSNPPPAAAPEEDDPFADVPELTTFLATSHVDRVWGLKLVADSVAQQRQTANSALIAHPLNLSTLVGLCAIVYGVMTAQLHYDWILAGITIAGVVMSALAVCRYLTQDYLFAAEAINLDWLGDADVYITRFGKDTIGACIVDWVPREEGGGKKGKRKAVTGEIKGWSVHLKYRGKSVGSALLEEVCKVAKQKGADGVEFAEDHANSKRVLPKMYNTVFDRKEQKSRELLEDIYENTSAQKKKK